MVMTRSHTGRQPIKETTKPDVVSDNVVSTLTELNFDDKFLPQSKPKLTKIQKCQAWHEYTE